MSSDDVNDRAALPKRVHVDGEDVEYHGVKDQLEADERANSTKVVKAAGRGILLTPITPPGMIH